MLDAKGTVCGGAALTNVLVTSLMEDFVMAVMQDDALKALISDLGEGIVIDQELLEGCSDRKSVV